MADTSIEWATKVWNPTTGCSRVSAGCDNCYAMHFARRFDGQHKGYDGTTRRGKNGTDWSGVVHLHEDRLTVLLKWRKPQRVFVDRSAVEGVDFVAEAIPHFVNFRPLNLYARCNSSVYRKCGHELGLFAFHLEIGQQCLTKHLGTLSKHLRSVLSFVVRIPPSVSLVVVFDRTAFKSFCKPFDNSLVRHSNNDDGVDATLPIRPHSPNEDRPFAIYQTCNIGTLFWRQRLDSVRWFFGKALGFQSAVPLPVISLLS